MLAELMSGKCSGVPWRKRRGCPLVILYASTGELQEGGEEERRGQVRRASRVCNGQEVLTNGSGEQRENAVQVSG